MSVFPSSELPEFGDAPGVPHNGASLTERFASAGLKVAEAGRRSSLSLCSAGAGSFRDGTFRPRVTSHNVAVGDGERSVVLGRIIYRDAAVRADDWQIAADATASILEDGDCAQLAAGSFSVDGSSLAFAAFFAGGFDEASAIGHGNLIVTFANAVFGAITVGGNGLDPEIRAEVEQLIRELHEE